MDQSDLTSVSENAVDPWFHGSTELIEIPEVNLLSTLVEGIFEPENTTLNNTTPKREGPGGKQMQTLWKEHQASSLKPKRAYRRKEPAQYCGFPKGKEMSYCATTSSLDYVDHPFLTQHQNMVFRQMHILMITTNLAMERWIGRDEGAGKKYNCVLCPKNYTKRWSLKQHIMKEHPGQEGEMPMPQP